MDLKITKDVVFSNSKIYFEADNTVRFSGIQHRTIFISKKFPNNIYLLKLIGGSGWSRRGMTAYYGTEYMIAKVTDGKVGTVYSGEFGNSYRAGTKKLIEEFLPLL